MNKLYYGDCFSIMQDMPLSCIDLIYLDPPFNSNRQYNAIYRDETGRPLPDQVEAFCDTWELTPERERAVRYVPVLMRENGIDDEIAEFWRLWLRALRHTQPRLLAYLTYMAERLLIMHRILKPTGSLYLHCDPTASHYVKALLDAIFGHGNFRNELVWKRTSAHNAARRFGPIHDTILFYSKSDHYTWNRVLQAYDPQYVERFYRQKDDDGRRYTVGDLTGAGTREGESGQSWRGHNPTDGGRHWAVSRTFPGGENMPDGVIAGLDYLDSIGRIYWPSRGRGVPRFKRYLDDMEGMTAQDIILDVQPAYGRERMGYATQKPLALLERLIEAASNEGDVVLDPFAGAPPPLKPHTVSSAAGSGSISPFTRSSALRAFGSKSASA
jgi:DNA modification methylase